MTSYERKLVWLLLLLVVFLAVVSYQSFDLARRTREALVREMEGRVRNLAEMIDSRLKEAGIAGLYGPEASMLRSELRKTVGDLAVNYNLVQLAVLDLEGRPIALARPTTRGQETGLLGIDVSSALARLRSGAALFSSSYLSDDGHRHLRSFYRPIQGVARPGQGARVPGAILSVTFDVQYLDTLSAFSKTLSWFQATSFLALFVIMLIFARYLVRPYRQLLRTARDASGEEPRGVGKDETAFVVEAFQETIRRLREREQELSVLHEQERRRADQHVRLAAHITGSMTSGVVVVDAKGRVTSANPPAMALLGIGPEVEGMNAASLVGQLPGLRELLKRSLAEGETSLQVETSPQGSDRTVSISSLPFLDSQGSAEGAIILLADTTRIKKLQERVRLKENLASVGEMSAGIAHEFRNSLAAIMGFCRLIERKATDDVRDNADLLLKEAEGLSQVVTSFLRFAGPLNPRRQPLSLRALIDDCLAESRSRFQQVVFDAQGVLPVSFEGDGVLLRRAFLNLMRNAAEAALAGADAQPQVLLEGFGETESRVVHLKVTDNGLGVPAEERGRLFVPFHSTKESGTGLGLSLAHKIVVAHEGELWLEEGEESGACFHVTIPVCAGPGCAGLTPNPDAITIPMNDSGGG